MIEVVPTTDTEYIRSVFLNPEIYDAMRDDSCAASPDDFAWKDPRTIPSICLKVLVDGIAAGCYWLIWRERSLEAHTALLPNCRGRAAIEATRKALAWVFGNTSAFAVTSYAWSDSPLARWLCRKVGMTESLTARWPATRRGKEVNITYYELTREAFA
jgi:hypothetical protein